MFYNYLLILYVDFAKNRVVFVQQRANQFAYLVIPKKIFGDYWRCPKKVYLCRRFQTDDLLAQLV